MRITHVSKPPGYEYSYARYLDIVAQEELGFIQLPRPLRRTRVLRGGFEVCARCAKSLQRAQRFKCRCKPGAISLLPQSSVKEPAVGSRGLPFEGSRTRKEGTCLMSPSTPPIGYCRYYLGNGGAFACGDKCLTAQYAFSRRRTDRLTCFAKCDATRDEVSTLEESDVKLGVIGPVWQGLRLFLDSCFGKALACGA